MKEIYTALINRIKEEVPAIKWIDWDTGQLDGYTIIKGDVHRPPLKYPAALITIGVNSAKDIVDTIQDCVVHISIRLAFEPMERTNSEATPEVRDSALQPYDVIDNLYAALQGYETENFHSLSRMSQGKENSHNGLFIYRMNFKTDFEDYGADSSQKGI
ncbi:MAG TPA: hypothetical protein GXZ87_07715 [Bacteroidales bacterium]|nr:hypothetical protein [Bacteroidales bacterium]